MTVREFLQILRRQWRIVTATMLLALGVAALITIRTPPIYSATARVYLSATASSNPGTAANPNNQIILNSNDLNTYITVIEAPVVVDPLRKTLGISASTSLTLSGAILPTASLLDLTAQAESPALAARAANALGKALADAAPTFSPLLETSGQHVESRTIAPAGVPGAPISPKGGQNVGVGLFAGLLLGIGLALARQFFDTKVRDDEDLKALADKPVLAHIPLDKAMRGRSIAIASEPHGTTAEAIRRLRTNLLFVDVTTGRHSFVVTSSMPGEGKTTTAINLAVAMANSGARTLLVDGDLRNPSVAKSLRLDADLGLTTLLLGQVSVDDAVQPWGDSTLDVLPAGPLPPNPSELLGSVPMEMLFHDLEARYEFVIIDSPPLVPVVDAILLDRLAGGLIMVVAADRTNKRDLSTALKALETASTSASGFAMNFVSGLEARPYSYGYHTPAGTGADAPTRASRR
ncbi:MAG: polysaccharide biosynthesis tyrosine autokinase [Ornithinibacter sp.]